VSVMEGGWLDFVGVFPALSNGRPSRSCSSVLGGPTALVEISQAIQAVHAWWP